MTRRGSILLLAIFFLFVVELMAFAFVRLIPVELLSAGRTRLDIGATLAAEAGLDYTVAWMENELRNGREPTDSGRPEVRLSKQVEGWTWTVVATPDAQTPPNGISNQRVYVITAEASQQAGGRILARMRTAVKQESFAKYCRFVDQWPAGSWAACGPAQIRGRFHTNDVLRIMVYPNFYKGPPEDNWPKGPTFWGKVTAAKKAKTPDGVIYREDGPHDPTPYGANGKPIKERYEAIFKSGRNGLQTGIGKIPMPLNTTIQSLAASAWGGSPPPGHDGQVHLNQGPSGLAGIYVGGPVTRLKLSAPGGLSRQEFQLASGTVTVVEVHHGSYQTPSGTLVPQGSTVIEGPGATERLFTGLPNGVVYVDGKIEGLDGVNRGPHTLATPGDIWLAEEADIYQADTPNPDATPYVGGDLESNPEHRFGMVCQHLQVPDFEHEGNNLYLYAAIVCSNGGDGNLIVNGWENKDNGGAKLVIVGSLVEDARQYWASTHVRAGYGAVLQHDENLLSNPPPNFPCTSRLLLQQVVYDIL